MIVTCEECSTSFQLDESRIPATGARVRCSRCKYAFFLPHPTASQSEAVHEVAAEAAAGAGRGRVPPATDDLASGAAAAPKTAPTAGSDPEVEEEDWQFSEEVRVEGDEDLVDDVSSQIASAVEEEESVFGVSQDFGAAFDESALSGDASGSSPKIPPRAEPQVARDAAAQTGGSSGLELDAPPAASPPARDESSFGSVDDFSELMEDDETSVVADLASEIEAELDHGSAGSPKVGTYASTGPTDDLGDPESWDLVGGDAFGRDKPSLEGVTRSFSGNTRIEPVDPGEFFTESVFGDVDYDEEGTGSSLMAGPVGFVVRSLGWAATVALVGTVLVLGLGAEWGRWAQPPMVVTAGPLEAATISSGWVETSRSGPVLRFAGQIRNTGGTPVRPAEVQLALLDASGARLAAPPIRVGMPLPESELREASRELLEARKAEASRRLAATPLAPGEVRPFEALVLEERLPRAARRVLLEVGTPGEPR